MAFEIRKSQIRNLEARFELIKKNENILPSERNDLFEFLRLCELGRINKGKKLSRSRLLKYCDILRIPFEHFKKDTSKIVLRDMEDFDTALSKGKIRNKQTGKELSENTKVEVRKLLKIYLRWKLEKDIAKYNELTSWLDTNFKTKTPDFLTEEEVIALLEGCRNKTEKFLIAALFDGGMRAQEFLNLKYGDVTPPTKEFPFFMIDIKDEYCKQDSNGKGRGRKIGLYWTRSEKIVRDYLQTLESPKKDTFLFDQKYDNIRFFLERLGKRVLQRDKVTPHLFRHSSATFFANKLNRQELCIRYGWNFSSDMPDVYISRAGVEQKRVMETFKHEGMNKFKEENDKLKEELNMIQLKLKGVDLNKQHNLIQESLNSIFYMGEFIKGKISKKELSQKLELSHSNLNEEG